MIPNPRPRTDLQDSDLGILIKRQMAHCGGSTFQALNKIGKLSPEDTGRITQQYLKYLQNSEKGTWLGMLSSSSSSRGGSDPRSKLVTRF